MDDIFSIIFFIWIGYALLEGVIRKKKIPPPLQLPSERRAEDDDSADFEIPTLANDPNKPITLAPPKSVAEVFQTAPPKALQVQPAQQVNRTARQSVEQQPKSSALNLNFTQEDAMNAMVLSEIFSKPKALRKR